MKIEIIELLNLVHDNKAPKKVLYGYCEYRFSEEENDYQNNDGLYLFEWVFGNECDALTKKVEIIEEKPKKIDEWGNPPLKELEQKELSKEELQTFLNVCINTQQELIKAVNYLLEESDKYE